MENEEDKKLEKIMKEAEASYKLLNENQTNNLIRPKRIKVNNFDNNYIKPRNKFRHVSNNNSSLKNKKNIESIKLESSDKNSFQLFETVEQEKNFIKKLDATNQQFKIKEKEKELTEKKVIKKIEKKLFNLDKYFKGKIEKLEKEKDKNSYNNKTIQMKNEFNKAYLELEEDVNYIANTLILEKNISKDKVTEYYKGYNFSSRVANFMNLRSNDISNIKNKGKNKY